MRSAERTKPRIWKCRDRGLRPVPWGIWRDLNRKDYYFLCYGPEGRNGPCARGWASEVSGRKGMSYAEEDRVDDDAPSQRGPDD